jgi:hypothetical protein
MLSAHKKFVLEILGTVVASVGAALIIAKLTPAFQAQSTSTTNPTPVPAPVNLPPACNGFAATSTVANSHTHDVCIPTADIQGAPGGGGVYQTTVTNGHNHNVTLSQAQLEGLNGTGPLAPVTSSVTGGHTHDFTL